MSTPAEEAVNRLMIVYGEPKTTDAEGYINEYLRAWTGIEAKVLHRAIDRIIKTSVFWPRPAEVVAEATNIASEMYHHQPVDGDALDAERRKGWGPKDLAAHEAFMLEWRRVMQKNVVDPVDEVNWAKGQKTEFIDTQHGSRNVVHRR